MEGVKIVKASKQVIYWNKLKKINLEHKLYD